MDGYNKGTLCVLREATALWATNDLSDSDEVGTLNTNDVFIPTLFVPALGLVQVVSRLGVGWINLGTRGRELR